MRRYVALLLTVLPGCAAVERSPATEAVPLQVEVVRRGDRWTADFHFNRRAPAWLFARSPVAEEDGRPWRAKSWTVETAGVRLERLGGYEALITADGGPLPARVRIRFTPFAGEVVASYNPAMVFTDGSVALYSEQFAPFPMASREEAGRLPADLNAARVPESRTRTTYRDSAGPVLHAGWRLTSATLDSAGTGTYLLFGKAQPIVTEALTAVFDPQLPGWLRTALTRSTPEILGRYAAALGPRPGPKPTILANWRGPTPRKVVMSGSTLPGLIVMTFEGEGLLDEAPNARGRNLWFIAHESAHFWLVQTVRYATSADSWITEGGADLLAVRTIAAIEPSFDSRAELQRAVDDCVALTVARGVAKAIERNEHRAHYACGAVFALVAEASSRRPFDQFVRTLIDANRTDGILTRAEWLAELDTASGDPGLSADIGRLLDQGAADPKAAIASLFRRAGIRHTIAPGGMPRLS